jgi:hypothetical protein
MAKKDNQHDIKQMIKAVVDRDVMLRKMRMQAKVLQATKQASKKKFPSGPLATK